MTRSCGEGERSSSLRRSKSDDVHLVGVKRSSLVGCWHLPLSRSQLAGQRQRLEVLAHGILAELLCPRLIGDCSQLQKRREVLAVELLAHWLCVHSSGLFNDSLIFFRRCLVVRRWNNGDSGVGPRRGQQTMLSLLALAIRLNDSD
jgi:hypothetical protein